MLLLLILLFSLHVSCALKFPSAGKSMALPLSKRLPTCHQNVPASFSSLDEAVEIGMASKGTIDCNETENCCCGWWKALTPPTSAQRLLSLGDKSGKDSCAATFPMDIYSSPPEHEHECGDVAMTVGGTLRSARELQQYLDYSGKFNAGDFKVDFYLHIGYTGGIKKGNDIPGYTGPGTVPKNLPPWVKGLIIEDAADDRIRGSVIDCTQNVSEEWVEKLHRRHPGTDRGEYTTAYMFRRVFLAHRMARDSRCPYKVMMRARPDATSDVPDWEAIFAAVATGTVYTSLKDQFKNWVTTPGPDRCELDDAFAWGTPEMMDEYSVLYPDFKNLISFYPFYRDESYRFVNEHVLAAHLHRRELKIDHWPYNFHIRSIPTLREGDVAPPVDTSTSLTSWL